jgi:hypothetical protein
MKRRILIVLLTLGTIGGYGAGIAGMRCRAHARQGAFERHVAKVCVDAAREAKGAEGAAAPSGDGTPAGKADVHPAPQDRPADW